MSFTKIERNKPCPCGSGKKFKKCCLKTKENYLKVFHEAMNDRDNAFAYKYNESKEKVESILKNYSIKDILYSLFSLSLWLKNVTAPVRMQWIYMIFLSIDKSQFQQVDKVIDYNSYKELISQLIYTLPEFYMLEDYIPEPDWGEIKYCQNNTNYKIFYGCDIDGVYEFLDSFNLIHCSIDETYLALIKRSPKIEMENALFLQQNIMENIKSNCSEEETENITLRNLEVPSEDFLMSCNNYYDNFKTTAISREFMETYSCSQGEIKGEFLEINNFLNDYYEDDNFRFLFINNDGIFYPILPRRYVSTIFDSWGELYNINYIEILKLSPDIKRIRDYAVFSYIKNRKRDKAFGLVSPFDKTKNFPSDSIYSIAFISKKNLYLVYMTDPLFNVEQSTEKIELIIKDIENDFKILSQEPITLLFRLEEKDNVIAFPNIEVKIIIAISRLKISLGVVRPEASNFMIMSLEDLLGLMDEMGEFDELDDFFKFKEDPLINKTVTFSLLDVYGAFKDSHKLLNPGAIKPTFISITPLWGSSYRFDTLKDFWKIYPERNFFGNPRTWLVIKENQKHNISRLISRNKARQHILFTQVGITLVFTRAPSINLDFEKGRITDLLMQIIADGLARYADTLKKHIFFRTYPEIDFFIFPFEADLENKKLSYLLDSDPKEELYLIEYVYPANDILGIRISYNYSKVFEPLKSSVNRTFEINLLIDIIKTLNEPFSEDISETLGILEQDSLNLPRFKINLFEKKSSFPEFTSIVDAEPADYKLAKSNIAEIALSKNIIPGNFTLKEGETKLNTLKAGLVELINSKILEYNYESSLKFVISKADSLTNQYIYKMMLYEESLKHDVDYKREERYSNEHNKYTSKHIEFRYLVEKLVQLTPNGSKIIQADELKQLLGLIHWLIVIQSASDSIHYGILPVEIIVDNDFLVEVKYDDKIESMEKEFGEDEARTRLELIGSPKDYVSIASGSKNFMDEFDQAFYEDLGFYFHDLMLVLEVLTFWAVHSPEVEENEYYESNINELFEIVTNAIKPKQISKNDLIKIINFLTLQKDKILKVIHSDAPCTDLPIWEHFKRPMRYNMKPLVSIGERYIWGPFSAKRTIDSWLSNLSEITFPYDFNGDNINRFFKKQKENVSKELNRKADEIVRRRTNLVMKEYSVFKVDRSNPELPALGDFDILAFLPNQNVLINLECKDLKSPFCLKDAKSLREKLFGKDEKDKGYFEKVLNREKYLIENYEVVLNKLNWKFDKNKEIMIISLFVTRRNYWWTKFPPFETDVKFLRIDLLDDFIKKL